ncbi:MAG: GNAT family N-acetyltransferase [Bacteroidales bacterium]|nr:GNAT family N-acetyltransferase [Bacteroidales bacterium]
MEIKSLKNVSFDIIFEGFSKAFAKYELQLTKEELLVMINRRGFVAELSFGAFVNDKLVSFTFNGIGSFNGLKTAYDTGTGTTEEYRGQGLASKIFAYSVPFLKEQGVTQYLLEVLQHNTKAVSIYTKAGFEVSREFNYFVEEQKNIQFHSKELSNDYSIKQTKLNEKLMTEFFDFNPSWQNSFDAILRKPDDFKVIGAFNEQELVGYCIFEPTSGDVTQIAVNKEYRRKGIGTNLLKEAFKLNLHNAVKLINSEIDCESINGFLKANSISSTGKQFEMIKEL